MRVAGEWVPRGPRSVVGLCVAGNVTKRLDAAAGGTAGRGAARRCVSSRLLRPSVRPTGGLPRLVRPRVADPFSTDTSLGAPDDVLLSHGPYSEINQAISHVVLEWSE